MTHAQEAAAAAVEDIKLRVAQIGLVFRRQPARRVEADLVEQAAEIDEAADLGVTTAETGDSGHL